MRAGVIIPVYNESSRVIPVIEAAKQSSNIDEVIVVNDGSTDQTPAILNNLKNVTVLTHKENLGKALALDTGITYAKAADYELAVFLDGDLRGLKPEHVNQLLEPLEDATVPMVIGYLGLRKTFIKKAVLQHWGAFSGQRSLRVPIWDLLKEKDKKGYNEAAMNARLRKHNMHHSIVRVPLEGVSHVGKLEKEPTFTRALNGYAKTYGGALLTYARIELESINR